MARIKIALIAIILLLLAKEGFTDDLSPTEILSRVSAAYKSMKTYKLEGTAFYDGTANGAKIRTERSFTILLKKPNQYLTSWLQKDLLSPGKAERGAVWSDGTQPYIYMDAMNAYAKMTNEEAALAHGVSGGFSVPWLFISGAQNKSTFARFHNVKIEKSEKIGEEECYVVSSQSVFSKKETLWISKRSYLIRKYEHSLEPPEEGIQMPEMTDEEAIDAIKAMGKKVTEENKRNLRNIMKESRKILRTIKLKGTITEIYLKSSSPQLTRSDFNFSPPKGTSLSEDAYYTLPEGLNFEDIKTIE